MLKSAWERLKKNLKTVLHESSLPPRVEINDAPTLGNFKLLLSVSHLHGRVPGSCLPDEIPFGRPFAERFERLRLQSSDGNERARVVFYQPSWNKFVFGPTHLGDRRSVLHSTILPERFRGRGCIPIFSVHSHPPSLDLIGLFHRITPELWKREVNRPLEHFSRTDIESLVSGPLIGSIVVTPGRCLMALRTERTPVCLTEKELSHRTERLMEQAKAGPYAEEAPRVFTKLSCIDLGLSLYISDQDDPGTFRKVRLSRGARIN